MLLIEKWAWGLMTLPTVKEGGLHQLAVTALQEANSFEQFLDLLCLCPSNQRGRLLQNLVECLEAYLLVIAGLVLRQVAKHRPGWPGLASREHLKTQHTRKCRKLTVPKICVFGCVAFLGALCSPLRGRRNTPENATHPKLQILGTVDYLLFRVYCHFGCFLAPALKWGLSNGGSQGHSLQFAHNLYYCALLWPFWAPF